jgi:hypothetical protein
MRRAAGEGSHRFLQHALTGIGWTKLADSPLMPGRTTNDLKNHWHNHYMRAEKHKRPEQVAESARESMRRACALPGAVLVLRVRCTHGGVLRPLYCTHPAGDCTHCIPYRLCAPLWSSGKGCGRRPPRSGHGPPGRSRQRRSSSRPLRARLPVLPRQRRRRRSRSVTSRSVTTRGRSKSMTSCARCRCGRLLHRRSPPTLVHTTAPCFACAGPE